MKFGFLLKGSFLFYMSRNIESSQRPIGLLDADHFTLGHTLHDKFPMIFPHQLEALAALSQTFVPLRIIPTTNRPLDIAEQLANLVSSPIACAESGAAFIVCGHRVINSRFREYQEYLRPDILRLVREVIVHNNASGYMRELPTFVTSCFYPVAKWINMEKINNDVINLLDRERLMQHVQISTQERRLDIAPIALTKAEGLFQLTLGGIFENVYRHPMPLQYVIAGDDSKSALPFFRKLIEMSRGTAKLITVANADRSLIEYVAQHDGFVSAKNFSAGVSEGIQWAFDKMNITKEKGVWVVKG